MINSEAAWLDLPLVAGGVSMLVLLAQCISSHTPAEPRRASKSITTFCAIRLAGCIVLCMLELPENVWHAAFYVYTILLALLSYRNDRYTAHPVLLLLVQMVAQAYIYILPFAIYNPNHSISVSGFFKLGILILVSLLVPLFVPRELSSSTSSSPNPEQTASIASSVLFLYLDPIIRAGYRVPHLPFEQFPPLAHYDATAYLKSRLFPYLDVYTGAGRRHIFWGLMRAFKKEYAVMVGMILIQVVADFGAPVGVNRVLSYLENRGTEPVPGEYRPWVWIAWLFVAPMISSIAFEWYKFTATRLLVRAEAILTQLIFEHALRIRIFASSPDISNNDERRNAAETNQNLVGRMNNLITSDTQNILSSRDFIRLLVYTPIYIVLCVAFLYAILGWSAFVGLASILVLFNIPGYLAKVLHGIQAVEMEKNDARVQTVTETLSVIRMVKLFGWERKMAERIYEKREAELVWVTKRKVLDMSIGLINFLIPMSTMIATWATYVTLVMKEELTASKVFSSMAVFEMFSGQLNRIMSAITAATAGKVSLDRVTDFLQNTELLDTFSENQNVHPQTQNGLRLEPGAYTWSAASKGGFVLQVDASIDFPHGAVSLVVGSTGSGKTALLMALLGEMHTLSGSDNHVGGVAYAAQESWVFNGTIRENVIFVDAFDEERYAKTLRQCALDVDMAMFSKGDETEVGEKGVTLSGGQKARVTLARAVYSKKEMVLLDDIFAALDVQTAQWIVEHCFQGEGLLAGRSVVLVTHNVPLVKPVAQYVVSLKDGRVVEQGAMSTVTIPASMADEKSTEDEGTVGPGDLEKAAAGDGKLIMEEEIIEGKLSWRSLKLFLGALGGAHPVLFFVAFAGAYLVQELGNNFAIWWLGYWTTQYDDGKEVGRGDVLWFVGVWVTVLGISAVIYMFSFVTYVFGAIRASRTIHQDLVGSVLGASLRWLDTTPTSRIITRCTQDIAGVDGPLSMFFMFLVDSGIGMILRLVIIVSFAPIYVLPGLFVTLFGFALTRVYVKAQMAVKREMSNAKSPVMGHFQSAIVGLVSIRAYAVEEVFISQSMACIDRYSRTARTFHALNEWVNLRIAVLVHLFTAGLAAYLVYVPVESVSVTGSGGEESRGFLTGAASVGFLLSMAFDFSSIVSWWVGMLNTFEVLGNSLERILAYLHIEHEDLTMNIGPETSSAVPAYWPASGELVVNGLSARYSKDGQDVLHDISFAVKSGERIGVVGRTGSGKTSLTLALLRCIETDGEVLYDGISIKDLHVDELRSRITIIPQVPELLSGTLRENLDPFGQHDDATLNDALSAVGMTGKLAMGLDSTVSGGGANLSVGQRQIMALARALVRGSKLVILDEATSAIDYETETLIQKSLKTQFGTGNGGTSVIVVAHRLQTVMDADKIMVLDAGHIAEFDTPRNLMNNEKGRLRALVEQDALWGVAEDV